MDRLFDRITLGIKDGFLISHIDSLGLATKAELTEIWELSRKTNQLLTALFAKADLTLVDFKLESPDHL